jgi:hypothetical protein
MALWRWMVATTLGGVVPLIEFGALGGVQVVVVRMHELAPSWRCVRAPVRRRVVVATRDAVEAWPGG